MRLSELLSRLSQAFSIENWKSWDRRVSDWRRKGHTRDSYKRFRVSLIRTYARCSLLCGRESTYRSIKSDKLHNNTQHDIRYNRSLVADKKLLQLGLSYFSIDSSMIIQVFNRSIDQSQVRGSFGHLGGICETSYAETHLLTSVVLYKLTLYQIRQILTRSLTDGKRVRCVSTQLQFVYYPFVSSQASSQSSRIARSCLSFHRFVTFLFPLVVLSFVLPSESATRSTFPFSSFSNVLLLYRRLCRRAKLKEAQAKRNPAGCMNLSGRHIKMEIGFAGDLSSSILEVE